MPEETIEEHPRIRAKWSKSAIWFPKGRWPPDAISVIKYGRLLHREEDRKSPMNLSEMQQDFICLFVQQHSRLTFRLEEGES
jgi:hypothetical protein